MERNLVLPDSKRYYKVTTIKKAKCNVKSVYNRGSISNQSEKYGLFNKAW